MNQTTNVMHSQMCNCASENSLLISINEKLYYLLFCHISILSCDLLQAYFCPMFSTVTSENNVAN